MKKFELNELFLIFLVALMFFIIGNMVNQLNIYASIKDLISPQINALNVEENKDNFLYETRYDADEISSLSLNKVKLKYSDMPLKFLVAGHIYGNPYEEDLFHPSTTLMTNIQLINQFDLDMVVLLGDIVKESTEENFNHFINNFLHYIQFPVFNTVGNHDVKNRKLYSEKFGETTFSFSYKEHLFIFLDTNIEPFTLTDNHLAYVEDTISKSLDSKAVKAIHIFAHHVFFFKSPDKAVSNYYRTNVNYSIDKKVEEFITNSLAPVSFEIPVFIYTGDVGAWCGNLSPYYEKIKGTNVTTIATGIGNCEEDSVLIVQEVNNTILIKVFSLTGKNMAPIETYDYDYWKNK